MKVFISHAFTEAKLAKRVADSLKEDGFQVWDAAEMLPGENSANNIAKALQESEAMIVLLTTESLKSFNDNFEEGCRDLLRVFGLGYIYI